MLDQNYLQNKEKLVSGKFFDLRERLYIKLSPEFKFTLDLIK